MVKVDVTVKYRAGHSIESTYSKEDIFCPNCGTKNVWIEISGGDVYVGSKYVCIGCSHSFYIPILSGSDEYEEQVVEQIKQKEEINRHTEEG